MFCVTEKSLKILNEIPDHVITCLTYDWRTDDVIGIFFRITPKKPKFPIKHK